MEVKEHKLKIKEIIDETSKVKVFRCEIPKDTEIDFCCGQFFMVSIEGDEENLKRAYSIASSPSEKSFIDIGLDKVGKFSTKLFNTKPGDTLIFKGPYGKFHFEEEMKNNLILIAGGTGVTPLMSIVRLANGKKLSNKIKLLYSVKTPEDIIYKDELEKIKNENSNFDYLATITRPEENDNWTGRTGRIDKELLKESIENIEDSLYFLCGPAEFVKGTIQFLEELGAAKDQIKTDVWG
jgi:Na+-transporting NADH:ubiquinone oxidoreductase subunit F|tara:strand:+ start:171 stop:884 length:714 start_codon:yes stop_codon:yes gene_type:complete